MTHTKVPLVLLAVGAAVAAAAGGECSRFLICSARSRACLAILFRFFFNFSSFVDFCAVKHSSTALAYNSTASSSSPFSSKSNASNRQNLARSKIPEEAWFFLAALIASSFSPICNC